MQWLITLWKWIFAPKKPIYLWRVEDKPPAEVSVDKSDPYRRKGYCNFLLPKEYIAELGDVSIKEGTNPKVVLKALLRMFKGWDKEKQKEFVLQCLLEGEEVPNNERSLPIVDRYLTSKGPCAVPEPEQEKEPKSKEGIKKDKVMPKVKANLQVTELEKRDCPAVALPTATVVGTTLLVEGTNKSDSIRIADDNLDNLIEVVINDNLITVTGGVADKTLLDLISVDGKNGNDTIIIDATVNVLDASGVLVDSPDTFLIGGKGNDTLNPLNGGIVGGLTGVDANGVVVGTVVGNSLMVGGNGDDLLISGFGNDTMLGGNGDDTIQWDAGTLTDDVDGGRGDDTLTVNGNEGVTDVFNLLDVGGEAVFTRTNLIQFTITTDNVETFNLNPLSGDDVINVGNLDNTDTDVVNVDGGDGIDTANVAAQARVVVNLANVEIPNVLALDAAFIELGKGRNK